MLLSVIFLLFVCIFLFQIAVSTATCKSINSIFLRMRNLCLVRHPTSNILPCALLLVSKLQNRPFQSRTTCKRISGPLRQDIQSLCPALPTANSRRSRKLPFLFNRRRLNYLREKWIGSLQVAVSSVLISAWTFTMSVELVFKTPHMSSQLICIQHQSISFYF